MPFKKSESLDDGLPFRTSTPGGGASKSRKYPAPRLRPEFVGHEIISVLPSGCNQRISLSILKLQHSSVAKERMRTYRHDAAASSAVDARACSVFPSPETGVKIRTPAG